MDLEHEERLSKVEERAKSNTKRLDEVEERQNNLDDLVPLCAFLLPARSGWKRM